MLKILSSLSSLFLRAEFLWAVRQNVVACVCARMAAGMPDWAQSYAMQGRDYNESQSPIQHKEDS